MTKKEFQKTLANIPDWFDPYGCASLPGAEENKNKFMTEMREWDPKLVDMLEEHDLMEEKILDYIKSRSL